MGNEVKKNSSKYIILDLISFDEKNKNSKNYLRAAAYVPLSLRGHNRAAQILYNILDRPA